MSPKSPNELLFTIRAGNVGKILLLCTSIGHWFAFWKHCNSVHFLKRKCCSDFTILDNIIRNILWKYVHILRQKERGRRAQKERDTEFCIKLAPSKHMYFWKTISDAQIRSLCTVRENKNFGKFFGSSFFSLKLELCTFLM